MAILPFGSAPGKPGAPLGTASQTTHMNAGGTAFVTDSAVLNNGSQVAVGGSIDTGSRLAVNPQGTGENGFSVNMPSGFTGTPFQIKNAATGNYLAEFISPTVVPGTGGNQGPTYRLFSPNNNAYYWDFKMVSVSGGANNWDLHIGGNYSDRAVYFDAPIALNGADLWLYGANNTSHFLGPDAANGGLSLKTNQTLNIIGTSGASAGTSRVFVMASDSGGAGVVTIGALSTSQSGHVIDLAIPVKARAGYSGNGYTSVSALSTPGQPTLTTVGTAGSTTYAYRITAVSGTGETLASTEKTIATGNATLSSSNYVVITLPTVTGAESYNIYGRTAGAELKLASGITAATWNDTGAVTPSGALPTANTTGYVSAAAVQATAGSAAAVPLTVQGTASQTADLTQWQNSAGTVLANLDKSGGMHAGAVMGNSSTPTIALGSAAGTGATSSIVGTNVSGQITLNSGTGVLASGTVMTMTFANSLAYPNGCSVNLTAGNANFASVNATLYATTTTTTVTLSVAAALSISSTYIGYYSISGY